MGCYAVGLLYALVALTRTSDLLNKIALHAAYLGMVFHFVSLTDSILLTGQITLTSVHNAESVLGFLIMVVFMIVYLRVSNHLSRHCRVSIGLSADFRRRHRTSSHSC